MDQEQTIVCFIDEMSIIATFNSSDFDGMSVFPVVVESAALLCTAAPRDDDITPTRRVKHGRPPRRPQLSTVSDQNGPRQ